jgi:hypothetical protein
MKRKSVKSAAPLESADGQLTQVVPVKAKRIQNSGTSVQDESLSTKEQKLLNEYETDINNTLQGAFVVGYRLWQIREDRLYRTPENRTFAAYCAEKFDFSTSHANRLIKAHLCVNHLKDVGDVDVYVPTKESQVRCICDLKPEQQVEVASAVKAAVGDKRAGAEDFAAAREKLFPKPKREAKPAPERPRPESSESSNVIALQFDTNLVSLAELKKRAADIYNIMSNSDPATKQKALNLMGKLKLDLEAWAMWQEEQTKEVA